MSLESDIPIASAARKGNDLVTGFLLYLPFIVSEQDTLEKHQVFLKTCSRRRIEFPPFVELLAIFNRILLIFSQVVQPCSLTMEAMMHTSGMQAVDAVVDQFVVKVGNDTL